MRNKQYGIRWTKAIQNNYGTPVVTLVKGKGLIVQDSEGKRYLDFLGGIATNILGHDNIIILLFEYNN